MILLQIIIVILVIVCLSDCQMECGKPRKNPNSRIYRGKDATKNMFSYYIDLTVGYPDIKDPNSKTGFVQIFGGGTLISKQHILTVAHLFYPQMKKKLVFYYLCIYYEFSYTFNNLTLSKRPFKHRWKSICWISGSSASREIY